jgi:transcriptional regulator with GAF, ATPase, and Fis domain
MGLLPRILSCSRPLGDWRGRPLTRTQAFARVRNAGAAPQEVVQDRYRLVSGTSPVIQSARTVAVTNTTVLLLGESGTGKEVVARTLHCTISSTITAVK